MTLRVRGLLLVAAFAGLVAACIPVAPPPVVQTCDPSWRGYVLPSDHNYAGIGAYNGSNRYMCKATPRQGVRAQIQHLRNYADPTSTPYNLGAPLETRPFYTAENFVNFTYHGQAPRWQDLEGRWAVPGPTYWDVISTIYNDFRASAGLARLNNTQLLAQRIMGTQVLTAAQMGAYVRAVGNPWKPEISPEALAQIYLDEGAKAGVRGDIAFCQSILETGWFSWPSSPAAASAQAATSVVPEPSTTTSSTTSSTTTTTVPGGPTTTTLAGGSTTTSTTSTTRPSTRVAPASPSATAPPLDPVFSLYFDLQLTTKRY